MSMVEANACSVVCWSFACEPTWEVDAPWAAGVHQTKDLQDSWRQEVSRRMEAALRSLDGLN